MKTLTKDFVSLYIFDEFMTIYMTNTNVIVGNPQRFIINDCNSTNSVIYDNVYPPENWIGGKYLFNGNEWELNLNWSEPIIKQQRNGS
jgi:hypothetical protein